MNDRHKFDETARTERYFVSTLLTHLLLADNFAGLRKVFTEVFGVEACTGLHEDFEVVSELDPLRDGSIGNVQVKKLYKEFKRVAVPDLFLRWSKLCLVIEAKFFTAPTIHELYGQVRLQQEAIEKVKPHTHYSQWDIRFAVLTVNAVDAKPTENITFLRWQKVLEWVDSCSSCTTDVVYAKKTLKNALNRAVRELKSDSGITFEKMSFEQILAKLTQLVEQRKIYIGFSGGSTTFYNASFEDLASRSHYKVSDTRWSDNWLTLDEFLRRIFELKGYF